MIGAVFAKTLRDKRWFTLGWLLGFALLSLLMTLFYPAMHADGVLDTLTQKLPKGFESLVGNLAYLQHFSTYLAAQLFDIRGSIFAGIVAIIIGLSLSVGDEDRGYLRTLLALPIGRTRLLIEKWLAMAVIMALIVTGMLVTIYVAAPTIGESVDGWWLLRLVAGQWLVMFAIGSLVFAAGIASGKRAVATIVGIIVVVAGFILATFGPSVDWLKDYDVLSLYHYFPATDIATTGFAVRDLLVLGSCIIVPTILAYVAFRRRDINAS